MPGGQKDDHYRRRSRSRDKRDRDDYGGRSGRESRDERRKGPAEGRREEPQKAGDGPSGRDYIHASRKSKFDMGFSNNNGSTSSPRAGGFSSQPPAPSSGFSGSGQNPNRFSGSGLSQKQQSGFSEMPRQNASTSIPIVPQQYDLPSRKIYVGGISAHHSEAEVSQHLGATLQKAGACLESGNPIIRTQINREKRYMFVELRTAEESACLMQLDGIEYQGFPLRIRRCQEYNAAKAPPLKRKTPVLDIFELGIVSTQVQDTPNKVFIGGIPKDWDEEQIKKLLVKNAGKLRSFHLVRDNKDQSSKGYAFCEFASLDSVQIAMQTIHQMKVLDQTPGIQGGTKTLNVRRTGKYADQNIDGTINNMASAESAQINPLQRLPSTGLLAQSIPEQSSRNPTDVYNRVLFEENINGFVKNANALVENQNSAIVHELLQCERKGATLKERIDKNNYSMKNYLREKYDYKMCSTNLEIQFTAFDQDASDGPNAEAAIALKNQLFPQDGAGQTANPEKGTVDKNDQCPTTKEEFLLDMRTELKKFGPIESLKLGSDDKHGKVLVTYHNLSSAFTCYNLLNGKKYMHHPVNIEFSTNQQFE